MTDTPSKLVPALNNAIRILRYINQNGEPAGTSQIAQALGINPSTCFNILKTLTYERLLVFDTASKRYGLGLGVVELARGALNAGYVPFIRPRLEELARRFNVSALLWQNAGRYRFVVVDKAESNAAIRVHLEIGQRFPALIGALGRAVGAWNGMEKEELREHFAELRWQNPPEFESYWQDVQKARKAGYAIDHGNYKTGITTVAAIINGPNASAQMAISTIALSSQLGDIDVEELALAVKAIAREIGTAIDGGRAGRADQG